MPIKEHHSNQTPPDLNLYHSVFNITYTKRVNLDLIYQSPSKVYVKWKCGIFGNICISSKCVDLNWLSGIPYGQNMVQLTTKNIGGSLYKILVFCKYGAVLGFPRGSCLLSPFSEQQGELQPLYIFWEDDVYDSAADYDDIYIMMQCLFVTKNEHFLKRSACLFVMFYPHFFKSRK